MLRGQDVLTYREPECNQSHPCQVEEAAVQLESLLEAVCMEQ